MSRTGKVLLLLGFLIAAISSLAVFVLLTLAQSKPEEAQSVNLVIAFQNISPRTQITDGQVGLAKWPVSLPTPVGAYANTRDVVGKFSNAIVSPGMPIVAGMTVTNTEGASLSFLLEKGTVARAIPVNPISDVGEAIQVGDRVDVIASFSPQPAAGQSTLITQRLLADVLVIQVGVSPSPGSKPQATAGASVITLQLKEQEALVLQYAIERASAITLFLRPANDREIVTLDPVTLDYIIQRYGYRVVR